MLKPITFDRFFKSANKARDYYRLITKTIVPDLDKIEQSDSYSFIKYGSKYEKITVEGIQYVEGLQNYVTIYTFKGKYITLLYLKNLEQHLDNKAFIRVHKSYIVAINKIDGIEGNEIFIQTNRIPISRNYREQVIGQVVINRLWDKR